MLFGTLSYLEEKVVSLGGAPEQKIGGSYPRYRNFLTEGWAPGTYFGAKLDRSTDYPIDINGDGKADSQQALLEFFKTSGVSGWCTPRANWLILLQFDRCFKFLLPTAGFIAAVFSLHIR